MAVKETLRRYQKTIRGGHKWEKMDPAANLKIEKIFTILQKDPNLTNVALLARFSTDALSFHWQTQKSYRY